MSKDELTRELGSLEADHDQGAAVLIPDDSPE